MTRKEFLNVALIQATEEGVGIHLAKFADLCIEWATNEAIEKACEWIDCYIDNYLFIDAENKAGIKWDDFINDFRKAMKGE